MFSSVVISRAIASLFYRFSTCLEEGQSYVIFARNVDLSILVMKFGSLSVAEEFDDRDQFIIVRLCFRPLPPSTSSLLPSLSSAATFCDLPISAICDGNAPSDLSMTMDDLPVAASLLSDIVLGMDWFHFALNAAPGVVVHLAGGPLALLAPPTLGSSFEPSTPGLPSEGPIVTSISSSSYPQRDAPARVLEPYLRLSLTQALLEGSSAGAAHIHTSLIASIRPKPPHTPTP
ncbi:hypothetical protein B0H13DRAFT_2305354 [Mycena leptocephala]|nr:hypothetical protein B0H13DRAFT_2305354 [Mycena leptocephala]